LEAAGSSFEMTFRSPPPFGFDPVSASQSSNGIPAYRNAFYFVKLFSEMSVIEVGILVKGELDYPLGKLMVKCFG